jgi:predicted ATPase
MTMRTRGSNRCAPVLAARRKTGARVRPPILFALDGEAHAAAGRSDAALIGVDEAIAISSETGERWAIAEIIRIKAQILSKLGRGVADEVEALLSESIEAARLQSVKSWLVRAARDLVQFQWGRGREHDALKLLRSMYRQFARGFGTADLVTTKALMEPRSAGRMPGAKAKKTAVSGGFPKGSSGPEGRNRAHAPRLFL